MRATGLPHDHDTAYALVVANCNAKFGAWHWPVMPVQSLYIGICFFKRYWRQFEHRFLGLTCIGRLWPISPANSHADVSAAVLA